MLFIVKLFLFCLAAWNQQWFIFSTYCEYDCAFICQIFIVLFVSCFILQPQKKNRVISTKIVTSLKEKAFLQAFCVGNKMKLSFIINKTRVKRYISSKYEEEK